MKGFIKDEKVVVAHGKNIKWLESHRCQQHVKVVATHGKNKISWEVVATNGIGKLSLPEKLNDF
jgi:hypothetical protein